MVYWRVCVCVCVGLHVCLLFVVAASMLLVAHLIASAIHLEWKTNTLMKMTQTTGLFQSGFVSFSSLPGYFCFFFDAAVFTFLFGGFAKVASGRFHAIVYAHICCFLNICLCSTWTKFQTPATCPQLNFTLFKHTLSASLAMSPICTEPH